MVARPVDHVDSKPFVGADPADDAGPLLFFRGPKRIAERIPRALEDIAELAGELAVPMPPDHFAAELGADLLATVVGVDAEPAPLRPVELLPAAMEPEGDPQNRPHQARAVIGGDEVVAGEAVGQAKLPFEITVTTILLIKMVLK